MEPGLAITILAVLGGVAAIGLGLGTATGAAIFGSRRNLVKVPSYPGIKTTRNHPETLEHVALMLSCFADAYTSYVVGGDSVVQRVFRPGLVILWRDGDTYRVDYFNVRGHVVNEQCISVANRGGEDGGRTAIFWELSRLFHNAEGKGFGTSTQIQERFGPVIEAAKQSYALLRRL